MDSEATADNIRAEKPCRTTDVGANLSLMLAMMTWVLLLILPLIHVSPDNRGSALAGFVTVVGWSCLAGAILASGMSIISAFISVVNSSSAANPLLVRAKALIGSLLALLPFAGLCISIYATLDPLD